MMEYFSTSFNEYYLTDIIATILLIISMYFIAHKKTIGFWLNAFACFIWIFWHWQWGSYAGAIMNIVLVFTNIYGIYKWQKKHQKK